MCTIICNAQHNKWLQNNDYSTCDLQILLPFNSNFAHSHLSLNLSGLDVFVRTHEVLCNVAIAIFLFSY